MKISHAEVYPNGGQFGRRAPLSSLQTSGSRSRGNVSSAAQLARARQRRLHELAQENYKDTKIEIPPAFIKGGFRPGKTVNSRRVLSSKKTIANVFDDDPASAESYMALAAAPSKYPAKPRCGVCGYFAKLTCMRCGSKHCSMRCDKLHLERCQ